MNNRYEVTGFLGKGGFASVYAGFDKVIERQVAIKVLAVQAHAMDEDSYADKLERFRREAKASARIAHPNVVTVFDMGVMADTMQPYIVMEVLHGHSLSEELRDHGPLHPSRALKLFVGALDALSAAHELGIIHKDLKPSNLFLVAPHTLAEELKVVDFGIARFDEEDAGLTGTGQVFGTARYFAPEYISEQLVSPALDVYQMGLILVELLCGLPAVRSNNPLECVMCHGRGQLEIPESLLQGHLGQVIARSLSMSLDARYTDAGAFRDALSAVDAANLSPVATGEMTLRLNEVSTSMRAISGLNVAVTGQGLIPESRTRLVTQYPESDSHDVVIDLNAARTALAGPEPDTNPEAFTVPAPTPEARSGSRALPALVLLGLGLGGLLIAIGIGAGIGLLWLDSADAPPAPTADAPPVRVLANAGPETGQEPEAAVAAHGAPSADSALEAGAKDAVAAQVPVDPKSADAALDEAKAKSGDENPAGTDPAAAADAAPTSDVEVTSSPGEATVWVDGEKVGSTPYTARFADGDKPRKVVLRKAGYKAARLTLGANDGPTRSVALRKLLTTRPAPAPVEKKGPRRIPIAR